MRVVGRRTGLVALFEDLEQQAQGLLLLERDGLVSDLASAAYAEVDLASRLHSSLGAQVAVRLRGGLLVRGSLARAGADFVVCEDARGQWLVRTESALTLSGLSPRGTPEQARPVLARLSLSAMLRRLADERADCVLHLVEGQRVEGRIARVGRDFFEVDDGRLCVPCSALAGLRVDR